MNWKKLKIPYATLSIILFSTVLYFLNSGGNPYVYPITKLALYGVSHSNPIIGGILFSFTHLGLKHLAANMTVLVILGTILEQRLKSKDVFFIFLLSGFIAGVIYTAINPEVWVLGASAAICGLIGAGLVVDTKWTIVGLVFGLYLIPIVVYPTTDFVINTYYITQQERLSENLNKLQEYNQKINEVNTGEKKVLIQEINKTEKVVAKVKNETTKLVKGVKKEAATPTANLIHLLGGVVGALYILLFHREYYIRIGERVYGFVKH